MRRTGRRGRGAGRGKPVLRAAGGNDRPAGPGTATSLRIGCGADAHPLRPGRRLVIGGVTIPHRLGLDGHSDADVLAHAVCDALLGAAGLADLGTRYPADDEAHRGRSGLWFLRDVIRLVRESGYEIVNLDSVVLADAPRLQAHLASMRAAMAGALGIPEDRVSLKAKRLEGLGAIGRQEGIMAQAVALLAGRGR